MKDYDENIERHYHPENFIPDYIEIEPADPDPDYFLENNLINDDSLPMEGEIL